MKILFIGDIVGQASCDYLESRLSAIVRENEIDIVIANGENSADGNGITPQTAAQLLRAGVDVITTGNHGLQRKEIFSFMDENERIIRPANFGENVPGRGLCELDMGFCKVAVINLQGNVFMPFAADNPFVAADRVISGLDTKTIIVDFHAEATSEKLALAHFLSGRVSAVLGTHTHVQTADETVFDGHTAYISDVGMTGGEGSIIGMKKEAIIEKFVNYYPSKGEFATENIKMNTVILNIDTKTGQCLQIQRHNF